MENQNFATASAPFIKAGVLPKALLPIAPPDAKVDRRWRIDGKALGKAPGRFLSAKGAWGGLWGDYVLDGASASDRAAWAEWPTGNVGLIGRAFPAIDADSMSPEAARLVERAMVETFGKDAFAERVRGKGPRRLYAFRAAAPGDEARLVRTRHLHFRLPSDPEHVKHGLDIIGYGAQYLVAGIHPSGDLYEWVEGASLAEPATVQNLARVEDDDMERFLEVLRREVEAAGGSIISERGGKHHGPTVNYGDAEPAMPVIDILEGLKRVPNTEENFPYREDLVAVLSAIRAALGREVAEHEAEIEAWATADDAWCPPEYFDKVWQSLSGGVRISPDVLGQIFRRNGAGSIAARAVFPDDAKEISEAVRRHIKGEHDERAELLAEVADRYVFQEVNMLADDAATARVRSLADVTVELKAVDWFYGKSLDIDGRGLLREIRSHDRWGRKANEDGLWNFLADLKKAHPDVFYSGETENPNFDRGQMIEETIGWNDSGPLVKRYLNMRPLPQVQRLARKPSKNQRRDEADVDALLEFVDRIFGPYAGYELDTLAYMAQTGRRPGHLLFLVGDGGVGKSAYAMLLKRIFDGDTKGSIDGTKLTDQGALRFAFANMGAQRVLEIRELPDSSRSTTRETVTSIIKQLVDPSESGDFVKIEKKGKDAEDIPNFSRVVITSNYQNAIQVEERDRRIFYVFCGITYENKPNDAYYSKLFDVINASPERLAAFWRFLRKRDVSKYRVMDFPPVSNEKIEQQLAGIEDARIRHGRAAMLSLKGAGRKIFDADEFSAIMTAMSHNEFQNSGGSVDDRTDYDFSKGGSIISIVGKVIGADAEKLARFKAGSARMPAMYVMRNSEKLAIRLASARKEEIVEALDDDRTRHPLLKDHTVSTYAGPPMLSFGKGKERSQDRR